MGFPINQNLKFRCKGNSFIWIAQVLRVSLTIFLERQNLSWKGFGRVRDY
jgi:hypothetical protein